MSKPNQLADIYSGFNQNTYEYNNFGAIGDENFQTAIKTSSYGQKNVIQKLWREDTGQRLDTSKDVRLLTRPSTAVRAVGYTSDAGKLFENYQQGHKKTVIIENKKEEAPEEKYKSLELKISNILEQSVMISIGPKSDLTLSLTKAKEASALDRTLLRMREQNGGNFTHNFELTYSVLFNLASVYAKNEMYVESLNTYSLMTKNKMFPNVSRLKMNMGNIYFQMGMYSKAIKMYRMALDQVPSNQKELRLKITHNIGILFIKMGQYSDAATSFEFIMSEKCDYKSGLHLLLCYYAIGDAGEMKRAFQMLLEISIDFDDDDKMGNLLSNQSHEYIYDIIKADKLFIFENLRKNRVEKCILMAAILISPVIDDDFHDGYTWCLETIKNSSYNKLISELDLNKAIMYLKQNDTTQAIETLKYFERKDGTVAVNATINLTFIYILRKDIVNAEKYAIIAKTLDSYNPATYINHGVCDMYKDDYLNAKNLMETALEVDSTCFEALYNMGLIFKKLREFETSLIYFQKIQSTLNHEQHPQVIYQIGNLYELLGEIDVALEWYHRLLGLAHMDPGVFKKIGDIYEIHNDRQQAYQYINESYRIYPVNLGVVDWIGSHFIELQVAEKAVVYYEKSAINNPNESYYILRVANCYRRVGNNQKSIQLFQAINKQFPEDIDCLRSLIHLCQNQGLTKLFEKYTQLYQSIEKAKETRNRISSSRSTTATLSNRLQTSAKSITSINDNSGNKGRDFDYENEVQKVITYSDPLGPLAERPKTGMRSFNDDLLEEDDLNPDELLPI